MVFRMEEALSLFSSVSSVCIVDRPRLESRCISLSLD